MGLLREYLQKRRIRKKVKKYDSENLKGYLPDTNILLGMPEILEKYKDRNLFITSHTLREVEHLELVRKQDNVLQFQIRRFKRISKAFDSYIDLKDYKFNMRKDWDKSYVDNILIQVVLEENLGLITNDVLLRKKARLYGIPVIEPEVNTYENHKGFRVVSLSESEYLNIYDNLEVNYFDLMTNEYCVINNVVDGELLDVIRWDGEKFETLVNEKGKLGQEVRSHRFQVLTPKDEYQAMVIDSILKNKVTSVRGKAGSGKSLLSLHTAWHLVEKKGYKLVIFVNPVDSKDSQSLGYYKGDKLTKLLQSSAGSTLTTKFGDEFTIIDLIQNGYLEIQPFSNLRGYDTGDSKVVVWILEAQNLTTELLKLGLQRLGSNTKVIVDGDFHQQIDENTYESDNGMQRMSEVFRGDIDYAEIELQNVYRSRIAELAEAM